MDKKTKKEILETMRKDTGNWKGPFYFNKRDSGLLVPKLHPSMGWTLNFASPYAYLTLVGLLLVIIASVFFI